MLRLTRRAVPICSQSLVRCFSAAPPAMAAGDTGSSTGRGSMAEKDQFIRREQANENYYVRQHEQEKMAALRSKMKEQEKHMKELKKNVEGFTKDKGGKT